MSAKDLRFVVDLTARVHDSKRVFLQYEERKPPTVTIKIFFERSQELLDMPQEEYLALSREPAYQTGQIAYKDQKLEELIEVEVAAAWLGIHAAKLARLIKAFRPSVDANTGSIELSDSEIPFLSHP